MESAETPFARPTPEQYREFFDAICDVGLGEPRYEQTIAKARKRECKTLYRRVVELCPLGADASSSPANEGGMEVIASDSLSGGPYPCAATECRRDNADQGARFAALYADHIVIRDPLGVHADDDRDRLRGALDVLYRWRPLLEAGIASHVVRICSQCAADDLARVTRRPTSLARVKSQVGRRFAKAKLIVHRSDDDAVYVTAHASEDYLAHGNRTYAYEGDAARPFLKFLGRQEEKVLSVSRARALGVVERIASPIAHEFLMQQLHRKTSSPNAHYASNIPIDLELANSLADASVRLPKSLIGALSHAVPFVAHASVADIVRFRVSDPIAFQRYRSHVRAVAAHVRDHAALQDAAEALRGDFAALEQALRASRSGLFKKARNELVLFGSIGIAVAGYLGTAALLPLLGGAALRTFTEAVKPNEEIRQHPLYFLWRVEQKK